MSLLANCGMQQFFTPVDVETAEFLQRRGTHGFVYDTPNDQPGGNYVLENTRQDHYDAFHVDLRHNFTKTYMVFEVPPGRHTLVSRELSVRAQLLEEGGPALWSDFMTELRHLHLGAPPPKESVFARLQAAYEAALAESSTPTPH